MLELSDDVLSMLNNGLCPMNYGKEKGFLFSEKKFVNFFYAIFKFYVTL
jgi:hypothetical protein